MLYFYSEGNPASWHALKLFILKLLLFKCKDHQIDDCSLFDYSEHSV